jgi:hypothetical protein
LILVAYVVPSKGFVETRQFHNDVFGEPISEVLLVFIVTYEPTVAYNIGTEDGGEFAIQSFFCHGDFPYYQVVK